jgi:hypothetical protein
MNLNFWVSLSSKTTAMPSAPDLKEIGHTTRSRGRTHGVVLGAFALFLMGLTVPV